MKGVIFNLLEEVVSHHHGEAAWDAVLDHAGVAGAYTTLGNYRHTELEELVDGAAAVLGISPPEVLRWYGRAAIPMLFSRFPAFFEAHSRTRDFVLSLNDIIHPEVMKLYPGARCPHFDASGETGGALLLGYTSPRRLCALAHGFIKGAGDHYNEAMSVEHLACTHKGDPACLMRVAAA